jgi:hypothetical protein
MATAVRASLMVLLSLALPGCYAKMHAVETTGGGARTVTTTTQTAGAARFSHGAASFSSGPRIPANAQGGTVSLGKGGSAVLIVGLVLADLVSYIVGPAQPRPLPPGERIMDTCSCYQKPVTGNE